jgi:hypothetical protein
MLALDLTVRFLPALLSVIFAAAVSAAEDPSASMFTCPALVMFPFNVTVEQSTFRSPPTLRVPADVFENALATHETSNPLEEVTAPETSTAPDVEAKVADLLEELPVKEFDPTT